MQCTKVRVNFLAQGEPRTTWNQCNWLEGIWVRTTKRKQALLHQHSMDAEAFIVASVVFLHSPTILSCCRRLVGSAHDGPSSEPKASVQVLWSNSFASFALTAQTIPRANSQAELNSCLQQHEHMSRQAFYVPG